MLVPLRPAFPVTVSEAAALFVTAPAEFRANVPAVLVPDRLVAEFSWIAAVPVVLNVSVPKLANPPLPMLSAPPPLAVKDALLPTVSTSVPLFVMEILVPLKLAPFVIVWLVPALFVIEPVEAGVRLLAVL